MAIRLGTGVLTVVPVTSNIQRLYPFQTLLSATRCGLATDSKAQAEQIRSIDVERIGDTIGRVPGDVLDELDRAIRLHLGL
jgi:mRNA interferase MazF